MTSRAIEERSAQRALDHAVAVFTARGSSAAALLKDARERADALLEASEPAPGPGAIAAAFAGEVLGSMLAAESLAVEQVAELAEDLAAGAAVPPTMLLRESLRSPALQTLDPMRAIGISLGLTAGCARLRRVSLWSSDALGAISCVADTATGAPSAVACALARATIRGEGAEREGEMQGVPILRAGEPVAALVARSPRGRRARTAAILAVARTPIGAALERALLLASTAASERMLLAASERRLTRLGFDLHDGPLQELLLVGEDLALFRRQLAVVLEGRRGNELLGGRLDDLDARLLALESGLRRISTSVHSDVLVTRPFADALRDLLGAFQARSGIEPDLELDGDLESISTSQRLAVLSVVGEALNNVREHGEASAVRVRIALDREGLRAHVTDDGRGFDVERELLRAARSGHMGLAGMHERVRLLDGLCRVESRPGGPTEVTLALPHWEAPAVSTPSTPATPDRRRARGA